SYRGWYQSKLNRFRAVFSNRQRNLAIAESNIRARGRAERIVGACFYFFKGICRVTSRRNGVQDQTSVCIRRARYVPGGPVPQGRLRDQHHKSSGCGVAILLTRHSQAIGGCGEDDLQRLAQDRSIAAVKKTTSAGKDTLYIKTGGQWTDSNVVVCERNLVQRECPVGSRNSIESLIEFSGAANKLDTGL